MPSTALVIGAQGVLGAAIAHELSEAGWDVVRAGRRPCGTGDLRRLDLDDAPALARACEQADVVINTVQHPALAPERTVLREGGTLIDLIELSGAERALLIGEEPDAPGLIVADTGLGGVAYLAIAELLAGRPGTQQAAYSLMVSASGSTGRAGARFGHGLLTGSPHLSTAKLPLPEPWGVRRCFEVGGRAGVLRESIAGVPLRHYLCMQPRALGSLLLALNTARLISLLPEITFTAGTSGAAQELSEEPVCEWVSVSNGDGQRLAMRTIEGSGYYRMTAAATLAFATALPQSSTGRRGLLSIDELVTLDAVRPALERHGVFVREQPLEP